MCAAMHHLMEMAENASDTDSDDIIDILPLHTEEEKEEEMQAYICTPDLTEV